MEDLGHDTEQDYDRLICEKDRNCTEILLENAGYREGVELGQDSQPSLQSGFDSGYTDSVRLGYACGFARGVVSAIVALKTRKEVESVKLPDGEPTLREACELRDKLTRILSGIANGGREEEGTREGTQETAVDTASKEYFCLSGTCKDLSGAIATILTLLNSPSMLTLCSKGNAGGGGVPSPWDALQKKLEGVGEWLNQYI